MADNMETGLNRSNDGPEHLDIRGKEKTSDELVNALMEKVGGNGKF